MECVWSNWTEGSEGKGGAPITLSLARSQGRYVLSALAAIAFGYESQ